MGFDLTNSKGQEFRFNFVDFPKVLTLAKYFGWEPMGTALGDGWEDSHLSNECQHLLEEDAFNLANALKTAVKTLPDEKDIELVDPMFMDDGIIFLIKYFSGKKWKTNLEDFIHFCTGGDLTIQ
jgi:hypothetical protein